MSEPHRRPLDAPEHRAIGKQIKLPLSKAAEISLKSLRVRFWRSMLTVSLIILAIAFLTFVWSTRRVDSAVAIGMRPDAEKLSAVARELDDAWKPFELELAKRFSRRRAEYLDEMKDLLAGKTGSFKAYVRKAQDDPDPEKRVDLKGLPAEGVRIEQLAQAARDVSLKPDLEDWPQPQLRLAGIQGVVQPEVDRFGTLQLELQKHNIEPDTPLEDLQELSATTVWLIAISLMVCLVGITNAMLMSVTERFREIGTMKCLGALDGFIVKLFLLESTFQGVAGTAIGVAAGILMMLLASLKAYGLATFQYFPMTEVLSIVIYALVIGAGISIIAAVTPALRAAHMAPVEAMRVEE